MPDILGSQSTPMELVPEGGWESLDSLMGLDEPMLIGSASLDLHMGLQIGGEALDSYLGLMDGDGI